jgi:hypothetical protein
MTKEEQNLYVKIGVIVGAYFLILKPILEKLGISKTQQDLKFSQELDFASTAIESPFSPRYWTEAKKPVTIITVKALDNFIKNLYDAQNIFTGDDEAAIYNIFRQLKYKTQVSYLADAFQKKYKFDLLESLKNGHPGSMNWRSGLNNEELQIVFNIVKNLK